MARYRFLLSPSNELKTRNCSKTNKQTISPMSRIGFLSEFPFAFCGEPILVFVIQISLDWILLRGILPCHLSATFSRRGMPDRMLGMLGKTLRSAGKGRERGWWWRWWWWWWWWMNFSLFFVFFLVFFCCCYLEATQGVQRRPLAVGGLRWNATGGQ